MVDVEVAPWLISLPLAPAFRPTEAEFADPIAYILKIEKEAAQYGICKIIPPFSKAPDETALSTLNRSLAAIQDALGASSAAHGSSVALARSMCSALPEARIVVTGDVSPAGHDSNAAKFTTRRQQLGWNPRRPRGGSQYRAQKLVWESGEYYTLEQFQDKAKSFSSTVLGTSEDVNPLLVETLFWNAEMDKPISIEYANDIPGSAFVDPAADSPKCLAAGQQLASSDWNVRKIARSHGSLLKFMLDEVPGVTTPMVYLGMLFSWFAWHVEDHELHSLNYLHSGARKTWYAVPAEAAPALEEVIRLYGYGSRLSTRAAFTLLGEKTTILSPEILQAAGVPCCRLEQNPGEFVITFPRAYHLGFSHGFNCGEAANFATPGWLDVARQAAARRASMNHLPMLSHEQLLYLSTMSLSRINSLDLTPEGSQVEDSLKSAFVAEVKENNFLLNKLAGFGVESFVYVRDLKTQQPCSADGDKEVLDDLAAKANVCGESLCVESRAFSLERYDEEKQIAHFATPWGALPCTSCGILCFAGMALVQPASDKLLFVKQRKQKTRTNVLASVASLTKKEMHEPNGDELSTAPAGICRLNSAHNDDASVPDAAEMISLSDDNPADYELSPDSTTVLTDADAPSPMEKDSADAPLQTSPASLLELLAETYKEDSEGEYELRAHPDSTLNTAEVDEVGISLDAPWTAEAVQFQEARVARNEVGPGAQPVLDIVVSSGSSLGGGNAVTLQGPKSAEVLEVLETSTGPEVIAPSGVDLPATGGDSSIGSKVLCSFNCESNHMFSASEQDEEEPELADIARDEVFAHCASNEEPTMDHDADKRTGSWIFSSGFPRPYIFCLQHAVQAMTLLEPLGGATVLVICHSNLGTIEKTVEDISKGTLVQISLREASPEEVEIINTAIHLKPDNSAESNWFSKLGLVNRGRSRLKNNLETSDCPPGSLTVDQGLVKQKNGEVREEEGLLGTWCGKQWRADQVHQLLGGVKVNPQLLSQVARKCDAGNFQKRLQVHRNGFVRFVNLAKSSLAAKCSKKVRKEAWEGQDRVLTAAILRKSKRNAVLKTAREQAEERRKRILWQVQEASSALSQPGVCKQAVFSLECSSPDLQQVSLIDKQPHLLPATSPMTSSGSGGCQRNQSDVESTDIVKWHEVPVACSPSIHPAQLTPELSNERVSPTAICSTSHQDTVFDDVQTWNTGGHELEQEQEPVVTSSESSKLVIRLKRKLEKRLQAESKKLRRNQCSENSFDEIDRAPALDESVEATKVTCTSNVGVQLGEEADDDEGSSSDEYSLKADGVDSEVDAPRMLPYFTSSKKRSCSKTRVKRATWDNLLKRLTEQDRKAEALQKQDSCPMSCITETEFKGWDGDDVYRAKPRSKKAGGTRKSRITKEDMEEANNPFPCDIEGCIMSFCTEQELMQHKKNKCTYKGCGKRFFSHKYLVQHRRVHMDDRPLKCPWAGCSMSFKWAWARTEHIRVHTGERPYACPECDKTFRFVSDFSRHKRNTGHARA